MSKPTTIKYFHGSDSQSRTLYFENTNGGNHTQRVDHTDVVRLARSLSWFDQLTLANACRPSLPDVFFSRKKQ